MLKHHFFLYMFAPLLRSFERIILVKSNSLQFFFATLLSIGIALLVGFLLFGPSGRDDVYMTLWPAQQLASKGEIINYNGDHLEQSSSLLHVLSLALAHKVLGGNIVKLNFFLILMIGLSSMALTVKLGQKLNLNHWHIALAIGAQSCFLYWSMAGLDAVFAAFLWLLFIYFWTSDFNWRSKLMIVICLMGISLVRPENVFILIGSGILYCSHYYFFLNSKDRKSIESSKRPILILLGLIFVCFFSFSIHYFCGSNIFPQPVIAKASTPDFSRLVMGIKYVYHQIRFHPELLPLIIGLGIIGIQIIRKRISDQRIILALSIAFTGLSFIVFVGGDWMENARFFVPFVPIMLLLAFYSIQALSSKLKSAISILFLALNFWGLLQTARFQGTGYGLLTKPTFPTSFDASEMAFSEINNRDHLRDLRPLQALRAETNRIFKQKGKQVTILSHQAGYMMFHLAQSNFGEFQFIDLMGLCSSEFTDCAITKNRGNLNGGLNMDLIYFFDDLQNIEKTCGIAAPDIVFDLDEQSFLLSKDLIANGYQIVDRQTGIMPQGKGFFPGLEIDAIEFLAVHTRWATERETKEYEFGSDQQ